MRPALLQLFCILTIALLLVDPAAARPKTPNIVLILVDDLGWSDLGAYGSEIPTPNLDSLAAAGLRFTQFHNHAKCFPSRAALLTGLYPQQVNRAERAYTPMTDAATIASSLKAAGYRTLMVGKHHGIENPISFGFDRYRGLRDGAANHFNPGPRARPGEPPPARKRVRTWCFDGDCTNTYQPPDPQFYSTDAYTDWAIEFLRETRSRQPIQPFLLYLAYQAPHDPLQAPAANVHKFAGQYRQGYASIARARYARMRATGLIDDSFALPAPTYRTWSTLSAAERREQTLRMQVYAAMIDRLDENIGRLVEFLQAGDLFDNTLILFMSDNGASAEWVLTGTPPREIGHTHPIGSVGRWASLGPDWAGVANTPYRFYKNYSHQGGVATPLIAHWPTGIKQPGRIVHEPGYFLDIHPTLLAVTGAVYTGGPAGATADLPGADLSPLLHKDVTIKRPQPIFQRWQHSRSVRDGRWKLVSHAEGKTAEAGTWALYDMQRDKTETRDLAAHHPAIVARLAGAYDRWHARFAKPATDAD
ncbi:sulfatase-like hydrolase/transferase [Exilibacterium tricleocarpae]|uniref:Sulfatase-like hydrolase/transferase n=1 Tax=Exilibacterium tricleocarpae TaxID=2591008 RepID=A0A545U9S7_9GAMM|nr:sulfatase-like hydrolase/transferase [Exilibacterium tricleocarpae]TQV86222.1 sulfatase-like hydrolase/transferase [Exilibacterium tricleocarpae]